MKVLSRALELEAQGRKIVHLEVGQPKTGAPSKVQEGTEGYLRRPWEPWSVGHHGIRINLRS